MDRHWRALINPKGGAPGYTTPPEQIQTIRRASPGQEALYRDVNGTEFTMSDCQAKLPHLTRDAITWRLKRRSTFEEVIS